MIIFNRFLKYIILFFLMIYGSYAYAVDLRGRVDGHDRYRGYYSATKSKVEIFFDNGRNLNLTQSTYTGRDGFYYFRNIRPGAHVIIVEGRTRVSVRILNKKYQDIGPILLQR